MATEATTGVLMHPFRAGFSPSGRLALRTRPADSTIHLMATQNTPLSSDALRQLELLGVGKPVEALPTFASLAERSSTLTEGHILQLASILFDPLPQAQLDCHQSPYAQEQYRMARLSAWLPPALAALDGLAIDHPVLEPLLLAGDVGRASEVAHSLGFPRLAVQVALCQADPMIRAACFEAQLGVWERTGLPHGQGLIKAHIDSMVWQVYELLAGRIDRLLGSLAPEAHWLLSLAGHFWFGLAGRPFERLQLGLESLRSRLPGRHDIRLSLLILFAHHQGARMPEPRPLESSLHPEAIPAGDKNDWRLCWCLGRMLEPLRRYHRREASHLLDGLFAEQLVACGHAALAEAVIGARTALVTRDPAESPAWFASYSNASDATQFKAFTEAGHWQSACRPLICSLAPRTIIDGNDEGLYGLLVALPRSFLEAAARPSASVALATRLAVIFYLYLSIRLLKGSRLESQGELLSALSRLTEMMALLSGSQPLREAEEFLGARVALAIISRQAAQWSKEAKVSPSLPIDSQSMLGQLAGLDELFT